MSNLAEAGEVSLGVCNEREQEKILFPKGSGPLFSKETQGDVLQARISRAELFEVQ